MIESDIPGGFALAAVVGFAGGTMSIQEDYYAEGFWRVLVAGISLYMLMGDKYGCRIL